MKARIVVATVSGKAYYLIVNELKNRNIPFISLTPYDPLPMEAKVVITTEKERPLIRHENVLVLREDENVQCLINQVLQQIEGKSGYEEVVIGVDPGEVLGLAVLADGKVIRTENCFGTKEAVDEIERIVKSLKDVSVASITIKVGDGVLEYKEKLLKALDKRLPLDVKLESVSEAGTDRYMSEAKHRRGVRDIVSAIKIAKRSGQEFVRRKRL
jgi:hypothetical protein